MGPGTAGTKPWEITLGAAGLQRGVLRQKGHGHPCQKILCRKRGTQAAETTRPWPQVDLDSRCLTPTLDFAGIQNEGTSQVREGALRLHFLLV